MIKRASLRDAEQILHVINRSNSKAYRSIIAEEHFREPILSMEDLREDFEKMTFYVYEQGGEVLGVSALQVEDERTGIVNWVYVLPEHQRRGVGTALVRHLESEAREIGLKRLWLLTVEGAYWATAFYRRLGYEPAGRIERPWGFDVLMEKELDR